MTFHHNKLNNIAWLLNDTCVLEQWATKKLFYFAWSPPWHFRTATLTSSLLCICQVRVARFYVSLISSSSSSASSPLLRPSAPGLSASCAIALCTVKLTPHIPSVHARNHVRRLPVHLRQLLIPLNSRETSEMLLHHRSSKHYAPQSLPLAAQHNPDKPPRYANHFFLEPSDDSTSYEFSYVTSLNDIFYTWLQLQMTERHVRCFKGCVWNTTIATKYRLYTKVIYAHYTSRAKF